MVYWRTFIAAVFILSIFACADESSTTTEPIDNEQNQDQEIISAVLNIDLANLPNYANQEIPNYITKDNTAGNQITDIGATLGRVLFYDKTLSIDNSISCGSCHKQEMAFTDDDLFSEGVNGTTPRHSMRLINSRFSDERRFFWDERATSLENQTTQPIQDHIEMGFSGQDGNPNFTDLVDELQALNYYNILFTEAFGDATVTEGRIQQALAQFIRSIQSFDSKFDQGRSQVNNDNQNFPNYTAQENLGKNLFIAPPQFNGQGQRVGGGLGCQGCHSAPEFDIDPNTLSNGVIATTPEGLISGVDLTNTRSPSLRDLVNASGEINGELAMHNGRFGTINAVLNHYNNIPDFNNNTYNQAVDNRLRPGGNPQRLNLTNEERAAVAAFIQTLTGSDIYTNEKWSDPFR